MTADIPLLKENTKKIKPVSGVITRYYILMGKKYENPVKAQPVKGDKLLAVNKKIKPLFSTGKDDWETPQDFFDKLNKEFKFTLDPCSTDKNCKCKKHFTEKENGLAQDWGGNVVFCNPPYSVAGNQDAWIKKCYEEAQKENTVVVALIPARTDTKRFHQYIYGKAEIRFVQGRLKFGNSKNSAPFPSMVVIWGNDNHAPVQSAPAS